MTQKTFYDRFTIGNTTFTFDVQQVDNQYQLIIHDGNGKIIIPDEAVRPLIKILRKARKAIPTLKTSQEYVREKYSRAFQCALNIAKVRAGSVVFRPEGMGLLGMA